MSSIDETPIGGWWEDLIPAIRFGSAQMYHMLTLTVLFFGHALSNRPEGPHETFPERHLQ